MSIKSETAVSLAALLFFGLMSQPLKVNAQTQPTANGQSTTASSGWNATLLDRNSPLMQGANLGQPQQIYAGIHNVWGTDPITQAAQRLTLNGQSSAPPTNGNYASNSQRSQSANAVVQNQATTTNGQHGKPDLSTPLGRFEYYRPIFERRAQQLNDEQRRQQLQFPVYAGGDELQFPVYKGNEVQLPVYTRAEQQQ